MKYLNLLCLLGLDATLMRINCLYDENLVSVSSPFMPDCALRLCLRSGRFAYANKLLEMLLFVLS